MEEALLYEPLKKDLLYIEDSDLNRDNGLAELARNSFKHVIAPYSGANCREIIQQKSFRAALIDYRLAGWVGPNNEHGIRIGETEISNGIQMAQYLLAKNPQTAIGLFSSHEGELKRMLRQTGMKDRVELVSMDNVPVTNVNQFATDFFNQFFMLDTSVMPLFDIATAPAAATDIFAGKKILRSFNRGQQTWTAGTYNWLAAVGEPIAAYEPPADPAFIMGAESRYRIGLDKEEFFLRNLNGPDEGAQLFIANPSESVKTLQQLRKSGSLRFIHELFIALQVVRQYLKENAPLEDTLDVLDQLSAPAQLESQKVLFKETLRLSGVKDKDAARAFLAEFSRHGLPEVLDIYTGRIARTDETGGMAELTSLSDPAVSRAQHFSTGFLRSYLLHDRCRFEYTVYKPASGGTAYHPEPL